MALVKNAIPILEYDTEQKAILMPGGREQYSFPQKAVFPFIGGEVDRYAKANACEQIGEFDCTTKLFPIYKAVHRGHEICLCQAPLGSSASAQLLDFLIGYGVREIISAGSCGVLTQLPENEFLVPTEALRDEGTSYHYLPPARVIKLDKRAVGAVAKALNDNGLSYEMCRTWTTDGFFRETPEMVKYRMEEGFSVVEMECASLAACARFRGVVFGQLLFTADSLAEAEAHDERDWGRASLSIALKLALDAVCEL